MELRTIENLNPPIACDPDPDMALVEASKRGDGSAFEEVVRRYDRKLFRISNNVIHCPEDAQEIVQMALFKAYQNLSRFQGNAKFSTWLIRITLNESLMRLRKQRATREQSMDRDPHGAGSASASGNRLPVDVDRLGPESGDALQHGRASAHPNKNLTEVAADLESGLRITRHRRALNRRNIRNS